MVTILNKEVLRILNQLPIAAVIIKDYDILYHNAHFIQLFETDHTHIGDDIRHFQHPEYQSVNRSIGEQREVGESTITEYMSIGMTPDGKSIPIFIKAQSVYYNDKYCSLAFIMKAYPKDDMDNIDRLRVRSLRKHQEFTFLQNLIKGLSHHINNKLAAIMGEIGMLQNFEDQVDKDEVMDSVNSSLMGISEIIRNLKLFTGEEPADFAQLLLGEYTIEIFDRVATSFNLSYEIDIHEDREVLLDRYYFLIVIKLLLRFLSTEGQDTPMKISIQPYSKDLNSILLISHQLSDAMTIDISQLVTFEPQELIEYMFPFHRADDLFEGTDLGAAAGIIKSMGFGLEYLYNDKQVKLRLVIPIRPSIPSN